MPMCRSRSPAVDSKGQYAHVDSGSDDGQRLTVWVERWQQECCGEAWAIGSAVTWTLVEVDADYLAGTLPPEADVTVDRVQDQHFVLAEDEPETRATVVSIRAVRLAAEPRRGGHPKLFHPVSNSGHLTPVTQSNGPELGWSDFRGYLVELDT
jgi:hypothetical protein